MFVLIVAVVAILGGVSADSRSFGKCPHIDPQPNFDMHRFLGEWHAIQRTTTDVPCLMYNITQKSAHPDRYYFIETHPNSKLAQLLGRGRENQKMGELCAPDHKEPAFMDLSLPYEIGTSKFTVFMTDYDNYAAIFVCKTYPLTFNRLRKWSAQILSRTPTLDIESIEKIRTRLAAYNVDPFSLSIINQKHCEHEHHEIGQSHDHTTEKNVEENLVSTGEANASEQPEVFEIYDPYVPENKQPEESTGKPNGGGGYAPTQTSL